MRITKQTLYLIIVLVLIVGTIAYLQARKGGAPNGDESAVSVTSPASQQRMQEKDAQYELAKEITSPDGFINTDNITINDLVGKKVVLVDFWTYSCINCQRTLPYLNAWYDKYKDQGLEIIGVHTPEFEFEKKYENVRSAVEQYNIKYPVVLDNDYSTWRAYNNQYWPRKYLVDIDGYVVYDHIGEGGYDETEKEIQQLLQERNQVLGLNQDISDDMVSPDNVVDMDVTQTRTPELYFGSARNQYLGNGARGSLGIQSFSLPNTLTRNRLYLAGEWDIQKEFAQNISENATITLPYQAKHVYIVADAQQSVSFDVFQDGALVGTHTVDGAGTYEIISNQEYGKHTLEIRIHGAGLQAFTFTFG